MKKLLLIGLVLLSTLVDAQNSREKRVAEWEDYIANATADTTRIRGYINLALAYRAFDIEAAKENSKKAMDLAITCNSGYYAAKALTSAGLDEMYQGEFDKAILYGKEAQRVLGADTVNLNNNTIFENSALGQIYNNLGMAYDYKSQYTESIKYYLSAVKVQEFAGSKSSLAVCHNNLGISYLYTEDYDKSEENFQRSFDIYMELNDSLMAYQCQTNLGIIAYVKGDTLGAIAIYRQTGKVMHEAGNLRSEGHCLTNIGEAYSEMGLYDSARIYIEQGIEIDEALGDQEGLGTSFRILGNLYRKQHDFTNGRRQFQKALEIAEETGRIFDIMECYQFLYELEEEAGNYRAALAYHQQYSAYEDSLQQESNSTAMGKVEAENEFNQQLAIQKAEDEQKLKLEAQKRKRQATVLNFSLGALGLVLVFIYLVWRSLKTAKHQKILAQEAKYEVEEKNTEILDSIKYAQRIQDALLKDDQSQTELPEHFVYFQPKDIVSGDFYWTYRSGDYWYLAAADCTGHGVPGAMLTMLGTAYLNELCAAKENPSPAKLLDELKAKITEELSQTGEAGESKDGMDISLLRVNLKTRKMDWAGANNPLYLVQDGTLIEIKGNKQPIGYSDQVTPFENHELSAENSGQLYLFTDGFADQFGGEKGKKFKYSNFKELLLKISSSGFTEQEKELRSTLENWRGNLEQLDDICVIGVKVGK